MMSTVSKSNANTPPHDVDVIGKDFATLRDDLTNATKGLAQDVTDSVVIHGSRAAKSITQQLTDRPVVSLLVAFILGAVGGRFLAR